MLANNHGPGGGEVVFTEHFLRQNIRIVKNKEKSIGKSWERKYFNVLQASQKSDSGG